VLPPSLPWPGETPWPQARRCFGDVAPARDRRPLLAAALWLALAVLLLARALG
jgi:hypothetical protein